MTILGFHGIIPLLGFFNAPCVSVEFLRPWMKIIVLIGDLNIPPSNILKIKIFQYISCCQCIPFLQFIELCKNRLAARIQRIFICFLKPFTRTNLCGVHCSIP